MPPPIITAETRRELAQKVITACKKGQLSVGKVERYADNRVMGYYQVMEWAQISMVGS